MNSAQAYQAFWAGFTWPAYDENTVPDSAQMPYITYEQARGYIGDSIPLSASLWTRSTSWADVELKANEIGAAIGLGGKTIPFDNGRLWILRGATFSQRMSEPSDTSIRRIVLNFTVEYLTG